MIRIRSLRLQLLLATSLASGLILTLLGVSVYLFMWHRLLGEFDATLLAKANAVAGMVELNQRGITFDADFDQMPEFTSKQRPDYYQVFLDDGTVLARSPFLRSSNLPRTSDPSESDPIILPDGHHGRALTIRFPVHSERSDPVSSGTARQFATVVIASRPIEMNHTLDDLGWLLTTLCSAAVLVTGAALYRIVGRAVAPVNDLAGEIGSLRETDLSRRLAGQRVPAELSPVVEKLNGLLARLEESFNREKAFTADVAHELRTPLAGIQMTLQVCRSRPRSTSEYESAIDECTSMADRLQSLIENLLMLARADANQLAFRRQRVDLFQLMQQCWQPMHSRVEAKQLQVENSCQGISLIEIDPEKLQIVFRNLIDNAVSYVNQCGTIRWSVERIENRIQVSIINTGSQIGPDGIAHIFDRFWRGDLSRSETGVHCGLGLSLCQRLLALLHGRIEITSRHGGEFSVRVSFVLRSSDGHQTTPTAPYF